MLKQFLFIVLFVSIGLTTAAQEVKDTIDDNYLEDQIYLSLNYNVLRNVPENQESSLFSGGFSFGFIKDLPINKRRNIGFGIGLGYGFKSYKNNFVIFEDTPDGGVTDETLTNKIQVNSVEIPFEFRWRTSTPTKYTFWRIYPGFQVSYLFYSRAKVSYKGAEEIYKNISVLDKFQYGATLSAGYGTWNIYVYYGLNKVFKDSNVEETAINLKDLNIGLKFYIL